MRVSDIALCAKAVLIHTVGFHQSMSEKMRKCDTYQ